MGVQFQTYRVEPGRSVGLRSARAVQVLAVQTTRQPLDYAVTSIRSCKRVEHFKKVQDTFGMALRNCCWPNSTRTPVHSCFKDGAHGRAGARLQQDGRVLTLALHQLAVLHSQCKPSQQGVRDRVEAEMRALIRNADAPILDSPLLSRSAPCPSTCAACSQPQCTCSAGHPSSEQIVPRATRPSRLAAQHTHVQVLRIVRTGTAAVPTSVCGCSRACTAKPPAWIQRFGCGDACRGARQVAGHVRWL